MSLGACLPGLEADGKLSAERAAEARALYEELLEQHAKTGSRETAEALASEDALALLSRNVERKEFLAGLTIKRRLAIQSDLARYGQTGDDRFKAIEPGGPIDPRAAKALIAPDDRAPYSNVEMRRQAIVGDAHREIDALLARHSADMFGRVRKKAELKEIVRELFGEETGNHAARELAEAWRRSSERLRQRFNRAGGDIGFRSDWGLPQAHDWKRVREAGADAWIEDIWPRLDRAKMMDRRTGRPFSDAALREELGKVFDTIRSDGATAMTPGAPGGRSLANARADMRFLVFKSAEDWMGYAERFGIASNAYDAMVGHIESMARDIAALEILGPNPETTLRWVKDTVRQEALLDRSPGTKAVEGAKSASKAIDRLWDEYRGAHMDADSERLALWFSGLRAFQVATKLGGAFLTAASDLAFAATNRRFNKLNNFALVPQYVQAMASSAESQQFYIRRGLIADEFASRTAGQSRYLMEELSGEFARRLADGVLRASLLNRHTQAMRWLHGMEMLSTFTDEAGKAFDALEPEHQALLSRYGLAPSDWDKIRAAPMDREKGADWISPHNLEDQVLASRFMEMIHNERDFAVPVADLETRATFNGMLPRGTWRGEIGRSALQFKGFGLSVVARQSGRILAMNTGNAARYAGALVIATTLMGAVSIQLKALAQGKDPRPMSDDETGVDGEFAAAALLQGGGLGIYGDFLFAAQSRFGGGFAQTLAGPLVDDVQGLANLANAKNPERSFVREAKGMIPGNNLWYTRLAFDRMVADQIDEAINPDIRNARRRLQRYAAEQGTEYWWAPGDRSAARAPDYANALEEGPEE